MLKEVCSYILGPVCPLYCICIYNTENVVIARAVDVSKDRARRKALLKLVQIY